MSITRIVHARVWTGIRDRTGGVVESDAVAFDEYGIVALGGAARAMAVDEHIDGGGGFAMPAFGDGHAHCIHGGLEADFAPVRDETSVDGIVNSVRAFAHSHPEATWIRGEGFDLALAPGGIFNADWLDRAEPHRPVVLRASDYHTVWVNSEALRRVGFTSDTPDPPRGEIVRDERGRPIGTLREWGAWQPVYAMLPPTAPSQGRAALGRTAELFAAAGVTWVQDAWTEPRDEEVWLDTESTGALTFRVDLALRADPARWREQLDDFVQSRARFDRLTPGRISATTIKFFADGVIESGTGELLEPYSDQPHSHGLANWEAAELALAVAAIDALGFDPHIHAIGDAGVRHALDAVEHAVTANETRARQPVIAHAQLVDATDLTRFVDLGVIVNAQPYWAQWDPAQSVLTAPRLGAVRADRQYPLRSFLEFGARLSFGSDWPVSTYSPLAGIQVAATRQTRAGDPPWVQDQRLTVDEALSAYTSGVGAQAGDSRAGWLRPGARGDVVLLAEDPRGVDPLSIEHIAVLGTWSGGTRVYGD